MMALCALCTPLMAAELGVLAPVIVTTAKLTAMTRTMETAGVYSRE
jgi:hypothetical protein